MWVCQWQWRLVGIFKRLIVSPSIYPPSSRSLSAIAELLVSLAILTVTECFCVFGHCVISYKHLTLLHSIKYCLNALLIDTGYFCLEDISV